VQTPERLAQLLDEHRRRGERVVFTNGCFDVLHRGHVTYLEQAGRLGDVLVVAVNSDAGVARLKGPGRPVNPCEDRMSVLAALNDVDYVVEFDEDTPERLLRMIRPELYVKGGDYTPEMLQEAPLVRALGGEVRVLGYLPDRSTTAIIGRVKSLPERLLPPDV
jgi:D-beta-D-heptose 7-phosphate kinase/D-beta-D-heptose 1-phosphate adenosyltransferase